MVTHSLRNLQCCKECYFHYSSLDMFHHNAFINCKPLATTAFNSSTPITFTTDDAPFSTAKQFSLKKCVGFPLRASTGINVGVMLLFTSQPNEKYDKIVDGVVDLAKVVVDLLVGCAVASADAKHADWNYATVLEKALNLQDKGM